MSEDWVKVRSSENTYFTAICKPCISIFFDWRIIQYKNTM